MNKKNPSGGADISAARQVEELIAALSPGLQDLLQSARKILQARFPGVNELVYDYENSLVIAYAAGERGSEAIVSLSADKNGLRLVFTQGRDLPDPDKILQGKARQTRFVYLEDSQTLNQQPIETLLAAAAKLAPSRPADRKSGTIIIKPSTRKK